MMASLLKKFCPNALLGTKPAGTGFGFIWFVDIFCMIDWIYGKRK